MTRFRNWLWGTEDGTPCDTSDIGFQWRVRLVAALFTGTFLGAFVLLRLVTR